MSGQCVIVFHGGAGTISRDMDRSAHYEGLRRIVLSAHAIARRADADMSVSAVDVAEEVVCLLEDEPLFNAGRGAVLNAHYQVECEASIMDGTNVIAIGSQSAKQEQRNLRCGAASLLQHVKNPVKLARKVMENTEHVWIAGENAERLAAEWGLELRPQEYFVTEKRRQQLEDDKRARDNKKATPPANSKGTVGCVVFLRGHLAAATSTGGRTNKAAGRIGDTPTIGAGNYANNMTCACSGTGTGEEFQRRLTAFDVHARMLYGHKSLEQAVQEAVAQLPQGAGGLIAVDRRGKTSMQFNSDGMYRGWVRGPKDCGMGIWSEEVAVDV